MKEGYKIWLSPRRPNLDAMRFSDSLSGGTEVHACINVRTDAHANWDFATFDDVGEIK